MRVGLTIERSVERRQSGSGTGSETVLAATSPDIVIPLRCCWLLVRGLRFVALHSFRRGYRPMRCWRFGDRGLCDRHLGVRRIGGALGQDATMVAALDHTTMRCGSGAAVIRILSAYLILAHEGVPRGTLCAAAPACATKLEGSLGTIHADKHVTIIGRARCCCHYFIDHWRLCDWHLYHGRLLGHRRLCDGHLCHGRLLARRVQWARAQDTTMVTALDHTTMGRSSCAAMIPM